MTITPGPWKLRCSAHGYDVHPDADADFENIIAEVRCPDGVDPDLFAANCVLMKASPALRSALSDLIVKAEEAGLRVPKSAYDAMKSARRDHR